MLKKFTEGLVFGGGFGISFLALWYVAAYLITPMFVGSQIEQVANRHLYDLDTKTQSSISRNPETLRESGPPFHELKIEEQIKKSSVIALAKYEPSPDGKMKAIIKEFLKKEPGVTLYYNIGDEYASSSYYPKDKTSYGDGLVIFFIGSPATMQMSMTYSSDRIRSLGDIPLELFKKKCKEPNA
jgi:hypothetical protein